MGLPGSDEGARAGEAALELLVGHHFEVIITDLFLPGLNGITLLKRVKELALPANVIMITGQASLILRRLATSTPAATSMSISSSSASGDNTTPLPM